MDKEKYILLTIDVEDWFQVENFRPWIPFETWDQRELRVERNVHQLLNLFDSIKLTAYSSQLIEKNDSADSMNPNRSIEARSQRVESTLDKTEKLESFRRRRIGVSQFHPGTEKIKTYLENPVNPVGKNKNKLRATFFVLGWIADKLPHLVREIQSRGHEVASHGNEHNLCDRQTAAELKNDLIESKKKLEDIIGSSVKGYRAPNFSVNDDILKLIEDCGYSYDSSYNSFGLHGRYGRISLNGHIKKGIAHQISENFFELPISNLALKGRALPLGGGGYFRLIPYAFFRFGVQLILKKNRAYVFYMHPWELDPEQPKVKQASLINKFKHYTNIRITGDKLERLIKSFDDCRFTTCSEYLKSLSQDQ